jgi:ribosomal protein S18 acetylase RimI-like enzyme
VQVRDAVAGDASQWSRLWAAYLAFHGVTLPAAVTAATWERLLDPAAPLVARMAVADRGDAVGFAIGVIHLGTWTAAPVCYLEDLYVDRAARGAGVGRALIDDLFALAAARGWSRLYWHTHQDNAVARRLYDRYGPADGFVRYRFDVT